MRVMKTVVKLECKEFNYYSQSRWLLLLVYYSASFRAVADLVLSKLFGGCCLDVRSCSG